MAKFNVDRFDNLIRAVEEGEENHFDMRGYGYGCGSPACALGHYAFRTDLQSEFLLGGDNLSLKNGKSLNYDDPEVADHFGITQGEAADLFAPDDGCDGALDDKAKALDYLREFRDCKLTDDYDEKQR